MFDTICTLSLSSDLFAQAIHPSRPVIAVGLASGHVVSYRLPPPANKLSVQNGNNAIETSWRTKRHKGSCRDLAFSTDGEQLYSAGTDGIVKIASAETGRVALKIAVPREDSVFDAPSLLHALSPQSLLLATDTSALHVYDLRGPSTRPEQTYYPHDDYVSSITPLPPTEATTSGFSKQWVSTGGTTLAITDLRRGVLVKSEDQEEELLSTLFVGGLVSKHGRKGEKVLVGDGNGVVTVWERGAWEDQEERIVLERGGTGGKESVDALAEVPDEIGEGKCVVVGMGDGFIKVVKVGINRVVGECRHDEIEGVVGLGFEKGGRMISGGGLVVKIWEESMVNDGEAEEGVNTKRRMEGNEIEEDEDEDEDSSEGENERKRRKKRKRKKGKGHSGSQHQVIGFKGMD